MLTFRAERHSCIVSAECLVVSTDIHAFSRKCRLPGGLFSNAGSSQYMHQGPKCHSVIFSFNSRFLSALYHGWLNVNETNCRLFNSKLVSNKNFSTNANELRTKAHHADSDYVSYVRVDREGAPCSLLVTNSLTDKQTYRHSTLYNSTYFVRSVDSMVKTTF